MMLARLAAMRSGGNPNFANVQLQLHFEGTNGSTTFTDSSSKARTPTVEGNAQITTTSPIVGTASGLFDGAGDDLKYTIVAGDGVPSGDFTIEGFVKTTQSTGVAALFAIGDGGSDTLGHTQIAVYLVNGKLRGAGNNASSSMGTGDNTTTVSDGVAHHFALVRNGNVFTMYVDGQANGATTTNSITFTSHTSMYVGSSGPGASYYFNGRLDEIRYTKGVAIYTANFTPPSGAFPDF